MSEVVKRVLLVVPHLSTGGLPAYTQRFVEHFTSEKPESVPCEIAVVEWAHIAPAYRVQFDAIQELCPLYQVHQDGDRLMEVIAEFHPDIIHFQEMPHWECFLKRPLLNRVLAQRADFSVVVTSHGSFTDWREAYYADAVVAVCPWQRARVKEALPEMACDIWAIPIQPNRKPTVEERSEAQRALGFDRWATPVAHVLQVGLWAEWKNQKFTIEVAKLCPEMLFHFVGNQSPSFQKYWDGVSLPPNAILWLERNDVDRFLAACDALIMPSTKELSPISIREALGVKMPVYTPRQPGGLPVYEGLYDDEPLMQWININDVEGTAAMLKAGLG